MAAASMTVFSRRSTLALLVVVLLIPISYGTAAAEGMDDLSHFPPEPEGEWYILDAADVISNETEAEWDADLRAAHEESGRLVRLVTIPSMCDFDQRVDPPEEEEWEGERWRICEEPYTFDECFFCLSTYEGSSIDDSYAGRMFRAYGMDNTAEPSMLIGVSVEDRRFRYVMPDHTTAEQRFSGTQFQKHSWRLSDAADGHSSWEDGLEPHVEFGLLVSEGKTVPYPMVVQILLIAGVLTGVVSILVGIGRTARFNRATRPAVKRLSLGGYREMAVLIHARLTLDGNFGAMERYRVHIEAIEKQMAMFDDRAAWELRKDLAEIEACFEEMGLHQSAERQRVESAVAFEPLDYGQDIERVHTQLDGLSTTWKRIRLPAWAGFAAAGVFVAACFVEQNVALLSVSPYHFALQPGNIWPLFGGLLPLFFGLQASGIVTGARSIEGLPARGVTTVDFAALDWPDFGTSLAGGYRATLVGHDEHGSPIFEMHRSSSDSGDSGGGGG
ncbi:MAG: hypothetical protein VX919_00055, partial [Candidatus Thermoplasmatota archaeon]|nr:hypothetical protein [Candidatus Thermoplasmatota archaeon]